MEIEEKDLNYLKRNSRLYPLAIAFGVFFIVMAIVLYSLAFNFGLNSRNLVKNVFPEVYQSYLSKLASLEAIVPTTELEKKLVADDKKNLIFIYETGEYFLEGTLYFYCFFSFVLAFWILGFGISGMKIIRIVDKSLSQVRSINGDNKKRAS